jgi:hypothetical protein
VEALEDRLVLSTFYAATAANLIADINAANLQGGANSIVLTAPTTSPYVLTAVDNTTDGPTGTPVIQQGDNLTIVGNGDTIERSATVAFRLFDVASGASLTLQNVTLQGGLAVGSGSAADGGAIFNQGTLILSGATVQNNTARGSNATLSSRVGGDAAGGGIWSSGSVTLESGTTLKGNWAVGGQGTSPYLYLTPFVNGGGGYGGGLYEAGGSVTVTSTVLTSNTAVGGAGGAYQRGYPYGSGNGGIGSGGGIYVAGGTLDMGDPLAPSSVTVQFNLAQGGAGGDDSYNYYGNYYHPTGAGGVGSGGGISVAGGTATLASVNVVRNTAQGGTGGPGLSMVAYGDSGGGAGGDAYGGGLYIVGGTVYLDSSTKANTNSNNSIPSLPYGVGNDIYGPYILQTYPALQVTGLPSSSTAGASESFTVTALMSAGATWTTYTGTVHFTSSDPQAVLPTDYTFTSADQGVHTFTVDLKTAGSQTITATDTTTGSVAGSEGITVNPAAASNLVVAGFPSSTTAGAAGSFTVTARDPYGNIATGYLGTVHFKSSDGAASLLADYTFTAGDAGVHTFSATLKTASTQSITATDAVFAGINGSETGIQVNPAVASRLSLTAPATVTAGAPFSITVTALDASGNVVTGYRGTIRISAVNGRGNLPSTYTFTAADNGVHTFTHVVLNLRAKHTITMTDTLNGTIVASVLVNVV